MIHKLEYKMDANNGDNINGIIIKESEIILYFYESKLDLRDLKKQNSLSKSLELYN